MDTSALSMKNKRMMPMHITLELIKKNGRLIFKAIISDLNEIPNKKRILQYRLEQG